jgi:hypothetical protein
MKIPQWVPFLVAAWVIAFGLLRLRIATKKEDPDSNKPNYRKSGYYARSKRSHLLFGIVYILMGAYLIAMGFGYQVNFFGSCSPKTTVVPKEGTGADEHSIPVRTPNSAAPAQPSAPPSAAPGPSK